MDMDASSLGKRYGRTTLSPEDRSPDRPISGPQASLPGRSHEAAAALCAMPCPNHGEASIQPGPCDPVRSVNVIGRPAIQHRNRMTGLRRQGSRKPCHRHSQPSPPGKIQPPAPCPDPCPAYGLCVGCLTAAGTTRESRHHRPRMIRIHDRLQRFRPPSLEPAPSVETGIIGDSTMSGRCDALVR